MGAPRFAVGRCCNRILHLRRKTAVAPLCGRIENTLRRRCVVKYVGRSCDSNAKNRQPMIASHVVSLRAQLNNESDPAKRIALQRLLVKELDGLGTTFELLAEVQQVISDCKQRIAELRFLFGNIKVDRRDTSVVRGWLEAQKDTRALHETYSQKLQSKLLAAVLGSAE
jgi:hypothetical protein